MRIGVPLNEQLGVTLLVMVVALILKALWDLKHAPNGADVREALAVREALDQRLGRIEQDIRDVRGDLAPLNDKVTRLVDRYERRDNQPGSVD